MMNNIILVSPQKLKGAFLSILLKKGFQKDKPETWAEIFKVNTVDCVRSWH